MISFEPVRRDLALLRDAHAGLASVVRSARDHFAADDQVPPPLPLFRWVNCQVEMKGLVENGLFGSILEDGHKLSVCREPGK